MEAIRKLKAEKKDALAVISRLESELAKVRPQWHAFVCRVSRIGCFCGLIVLALLINMVQRKTVPRDSPKPAPRRSSTTRDDQRKAR
jgi:hypothetical protein